MPTKTTIRKCKLYKRPYTGRSDKIFCSILCKSNYHHKLRDATNRETAQVDKILHRNRSILLEIMGKKAQKKKIPKKLLNAYNFKPQFMTGFFENAQGKRYHQLYDFSWMEFSSGELLIIKHNQVSLDS